MTGSSFRDRVTAVVVTYNSAAVVRTAVEGLRSVGRVVVVDNGSADRSLDEVIRARPDVQVISTGANLGYGMAANRGAQQADTEFILMVTPDAFVGEETIAALVAAADASPTAGIVAPFLLSAEGKLDLAVMGPRERNHHPATIVPEGEFSTWFVTGAVWLVRRSAWQRVGGFDEAIFLYNDDADLCLRMTKAGYSLLVLPGIQARHLGGKSTPPSRHVRRLKDWHQTWSHLYLERKHGDPAAARSLAWKQAILHGLKALLYVLLLRPKKVEGNFTKAHAALSFLCGRPAR